jgi:hypothetical protein
MYTQPVREGQRYNLYHGTVEAVPVSATTSKLVYTLVFDNSMLADDAARDKDIQQRTARERRFGPVYESSTIRPKLNSQMCGTIGRSASGRNGELRPFQ